MSKYNKPKFSEYWSSLSAEQKRSLAEKSGLAYEHLSQIACGHKRAGVSVMKRLKTANPRLTVGMLRPDL